MKSEVPVGMIDCHLHHSPDVIARRSWALDLAITAREAGMGGILLKSHHTNTGGLAAQVSRMVQGVDVYGGVVLNAAVGGLNPMAVRMSGRFGSRMVWMPTTSALNHVLHQTEGGSLANLAASAQDEGIEIFDSRGQLKEVVKDVVTEVAAADMALSSGHLAPKETVALAEYLSKSGFPMHRFLVTHCDMPITGLDPEQQRHIAKLGGYLERVLAVLVGLQRKASPDAIFAGTPFTGCSENFLPAEGGVEGLLESIRENREHSVLSSDLGQEGNPEPIGLINEAFATLREEGFSDAELRHMSVDLPRRLLGLEEMEV